MITNEKPKWKRENTRRKIEFRTFRFIMRKRKLQWAVPKSFSHLANRPRRIARHTRLNVALVSNVMGTSQHRLALLLIAVKIVPKRKKKRTVPDQPWIIKCIFRASRPTAHSTRHEKTPLPFDSHRIILNEPKKKKKKLIRQIFRNP